MFKSLRRSAIKKALNKAIANKDEPLLRSALNKAYTLGIDESFTKLISQLLTETWHDEHEDLVHTIYFDNLKDDIFTEPLYKIATEPDVYRRYDDELEPTLRKCIHALKIINTEKANIYIEKLKNTNNSNVDMALSMYKNNTLPI